MKKSLFVAFLTVFVFLGAVSQAFAGPGPMFFNGGFNNFGGFVVPNNPNNNGPFVNPQPFVPNPNGPFVPNGNNNIPFVPFFVNPNVNVVPVNPFFFNPGPQAFPLPPQVAPQPNPNPQFAFVIITNNGVLQNPLNIASGTTVIWRNKTGVAGKLIDPNGVFSSGIIPPGGAHVFKFTNPGNFKYFFNSVNGNLNLNALINVQ